MTRALLDVNVLLALLDSDHIDHERAHEWFESDAEAGWASCAITENGFVRIISQPRYPSPITPSHAVSLLARARNGGDHAFWTCHISVLDEHVVDATRVHGPRQVTDVYLLALAVAHGGRLATFDRDLYCSAAPGAGAEHVVVL